MYPSQGSTHIEQDSKTTFFKDIFKGNSFNLDTVNSLLFYGFKKKDCR